MGTCSSMNERDTVSSWLIPGVHHSSNWTLIKIGTVMLYSGGRTVLKIFSFLAQTVSSSALLFQLHQHKSFFFHQIWPVVNRPGHSADPVCDHTWWLRLISDKLIRTEVHFFWKAAERIKIDRKIKRKYRLYCKGKWDTVS